MSTYSAAGIQTPPLISPRQPEGASHEKEEIQDKVRQVSEDIFSIPQNFYYIFPYNFTLSSLALHSFIVSLACVLGGFTGIVLVELAKSYPLLFAGASLYGLVHYIIHKEPSV